MFLRSDCNKAIKCFSESWSPPPPLFCWRLSPFWRWINHLRRLCFHIFSHQLRLRFHTSPDQAIGGAQSKTWGHSNWKSNAHRNAWATLSNAEARKAMVEKSINAFLKADGVSHTEGKGKKRKEIAQGECWRVAVAVTRPRDRTIIIQFPHACQFWREACRRNEDGNHARFYWGEVMAVSRLSARHSGLRETSAFNGKWSCYPANVCTQMKTVGKISAIFSGSCLIANCALILAYLFIFENHIVFTVFSILSFMRADFCFNFGKMFSRMEAP